MDMMFLLHHESCLGVVRSCMSPTCLCVGDVGVCDMMDELYYCDNVNLFVLISKFNPPFYN